MPDNDAHLSGISEHRAHLSVEDTACLCPWLSLDVDTLIVKCHTFQSFHIIASEPRYNAITSCKRHGEAAFVAFKTTADSPVF